MTSKGPQAPAVRGRIFDGTVADPDEKTDEISTEELRDILAARCSLVMDARPFMEYAISHIAGALNLAAKPDVPTSVYVSDVKDVECIVDGDKTRPLVLYCNGPFCEKSKRLSEELIDKGFTHVRRYQLGIPVWRALGGLTQIELEGIKYVHSLDLTAIFVDARDPQAFSVGSVGRARNVPACDVKPGKDIGGIKKAKDDGRLPMEDHNTRIVVFGRDGAQARIVAEAIIHEAFHNVAFFDGPLEMINAAI